jgi:type I restriction enzyme R subunit
MYVDKRLDGVKAVQTLSRLNRTCPGKEDTFILDFVNSREEILAAFQPYYEQTELTDTTDPNKLYDLKTAIESYRVLRPEEIDGFCRVFFARAGSVSKDEHAKLNAFIDSAVERFKVIEDEQQREAFTNSVTVFVRLYAFVAQIMPFNDIDLEKFYAFCRFFLRKLPRRNAGERYRLDDEVALEYYRLKKIAEGSLTLQKDGTAPLKPVSKAGDREDKEQRARLSEIIRLLNDRFGTDFTEADKLFIDSIEEEMMQDDKLALQAKNNPIDNFKFGFDEIFIDKVIDRMEQNQDIVNKIMDDKVFAGVLKEYLMRKVYGRLNEERK